MDNWVKYEPDNMPEDGKEYVITDGNWFEIATFYNSNGKQEWSFGYFSDIKDITVVTHYAKLNFPKK